MNALQNLESLLTRELNEINSIINKNNSPFLFVDLLKALDYFTISNYKNKEKFDYFIQFGYSRFLNQLYSKSNFKGGGLPLYQSTKEGLSFCHYYLVQYGKCRVVERSIELVKSGEVDLEQITPLNFKIITSEKSGIEYIENKSIESYFQIMSDYVCKNKIAELEDRKNDILKKFGKKIGVWRGNYMQYESTPEIDDYYFQKGYVTLITSQLFDDFEENAEFGGIKYGEYLDVIQSIMGIAIKHIDASIILSERSSKVNIYDILPLPTIHNESIEQLAHYLSIDKEKVKEILQVLSVSKSTINSHLKADKTFSPMFVNVGSRFSIRSLKGCLHAPVLFLQNELKRKFHKDYFKAINERESVFRNQLYKLFQCDRLFAVPRNIEINSNGIRTDVDAVLYDKKTRTLALFQLKWQDKFSSDIRARKSRVSNFYPKAIEWLDKISFWINQNTNKQILSSLSINYETISRTYFFILGRYNTHFSNYEIDERAAWGSWYHVVELSHKINTDFNDPIRELYFKLKVDSPRNKSIQDELKGDINNEVKLKNFKLNWSFDD